jgi:MoaA/NifB/PqqE/SkfB family radical SAM enzyme
MRPALLYEITARCDRTCRHCYNVWRHGAEPAERLEASPAEPSWGETADLLDRAIERLSPSSVTLIGGEPLLDERTPMAVRHLAKRGVPVALSTHGGQVDARLARELVNGGLRAAEVSFCSDAGDGSSLPAACRAVSEFQAAGLVSTVSLVLARPFLPRLREMLERAIAFGAGGVSLQPLVEPVPGALDPDLVPSADELARSLDDLQTRAQRASFPIALSLPVGECALPDRQTPELARALCGPGRKLVMSSTGDLRPCEPSPRRLGSIFDRQLPEVGRSAAPCARAPSCASSCRSAAACGGRCAHLA